MHLVHGYHRGSPRSYLLGWLCLLGGSAWGQLVPQSSSEVLLTNGSSYIILNQNIQLTQGALIGFSFRTCLPSGELLRQIGESNNLFTVNFSEAGGVRVILEDGEDQRRVLEAGSNLADGAWHTVRIGVSPGRTSLCLSVDGVGLDIECTEPRTGPALVTPSSQPALTRLDAVESILAALDFSGASSQLRVGSGLVGCVREGPGLRLGGVADSSGITWGPCLLPQTCSGYNWTSLTTVDPSTNPCSASLCENGGLCLPLLAPTDPLQTTACSCAPGYSGSSCSVLSTSCSQSPCLHSASCQEEPNSGYSCNCGGSGYSGTHCETELNHCTEGVCENEGECLDQPGGFLCDCQLGFTGTTCAVRINAQEPTSRDIKDPCLSMPSPCRNGGTCSTNSTAMVCSCAPGFSGVLCEVDQDPCANTICPNNSQCLLTDQGEKACVCDPGYSGPTCVAIDYCLASPCGGGGTCSSSPAGFTCLCGPGRTGSTCQEELDPCTSTRCLNGGVCSRTAEGEVTCACPTGFVGEMCEVDVDECDTTPCLHGSCLNKAGGYECLCEAGWSGLNCGVNNDECFSNPCVNATCQDKVNDYSCLCNPGFTGKNCEVNTDECVESACLNGGTCTDAVNDYTCSCTPSFMGRRCESPYDPCASNPCSDGATCRILSLERGAPNEFDCKCVPGFTGQLCDINIDDCAGVECPGGQTCFDLVNAHECRCPKGYDGPACATDIDECLSSPCLNDATCLNTVGNYSCACTPSFTGRNCGVDVDECAENADICNHGICLNTEGSYQCYCKPGYSGINCSYDFDECLSNPCKHDGSCVNLVNDYNCTCAPGFNGRNCENNIDECLVNPCLNSGLCVDGINNFTCSCQPGYSGPTCQVNIDDCDPHPCLNQGVCDDGVNMYTCNCTNTGFMGDNCEVDINECAESPCRNNATCTDEINNYNCSCWDGFAGRNCETDIKECEAMPCKNNGTCYERSDLRLYDEPLLSELPESIRVLFAPGFRYENASGYFCECLPGFEGVGCEVNINECENKPCRNEAVCVDGINEYTCQCLPGYEGTRCQVDIDECNKYSPCQNEAKCIDMVADYKCECKNGFGGKNCSVPLTGCMKVSCLNGGTCSPYLVGEDDHRRNCECMPGFDGDACQLVTTFSLKGGSHVSVESNRTEGFELSLRFRTTLSKGLIAVGTSPSFFRLIMNNGRLNLHSSMLNQFEGVFIGSEALNDTKWHKVNVAFNYTHLTIGLDDRLQIIQPINPGTVNDTSFKLNYLGGIPKDSDDPTLLKLVVEGTPDFVGCMQDISVNGVKVTEEDVRPGQGTTGIAQFNTEKGCSRTAQCDPNPCKNGGNCTDLWRDYKCFCHRPYLGPSCQYNYTAATFGYENLTSSQVKVKVRSPDDYKEGIDITMFIRTRRPKGIIFYLGVDPSSPTKNQIIGRLVNGTLQVEARFLEKPPEYFTLYSTQLANGNRHFIRVTRMKNQMTVKVNDTISIKQEISADVPIEADFLYLGNLIVTQPTLPTLPYSVSSPPIITTVAPTIDEIGTSSSTMLDIPTESPIEVLLPAVTRLPEEETTLPSTEIPVTSVEYEDLADSVTSPILSRPTREIDDEFPWGEEITYFKGVIQDVQLSNGRLKTKIVKLFELDFAEDVNVAESLGDVTALEIKQGVVSDDTCRINPCENDGECRVTWNAYVCICQPGFMGENCEKIEYCHWNKCPEDSTCNTLVDGHECVTNATFNGVNTSIVYTEQLQTEFTMNTLVATFRTRTSGTLLHVVGRDNNQLKISVSNGMVEAVLPVAGLVRNFTFGKDITDGEWHTITIENFGGITLGYVDKNESEEFISEGNSTGLDLFTFMKGSRVVLGSEYNLNRFVNFFRGCAQEIRIGGVLLPFFTETELANNATSSRFNTTTANKFTISQQESLSKTQCVLCYQNECLNGGVCNDPSEKFECACPAGFESPTCATNIDECENNSCVHGECVDGIDEYTCECFPGWTGQLCAEDRDECEDNPCQHGGVCNQTPEPGNYTCDCTSEYRGRNCDLLKVRTCRESPCTNGGTCTDEPNSVEPDRYRCDCAQGYEGFNCKQQTNFCVKLGANCRNGGTCNSDFSAFNYECRCLDGFEGRHCETNIDECASLPCKNSGSCQDLVNDYRCDCSATGFRGPTCEENIDECLVSPCQNGAACNDTLGSYTCNCRDTFCGKNCQQKDPCLEDRCVNKGKCIPTCDRAPFYECKCTPGWEGPSCQLKVFIEGDWTIRQDEGDWLVLIVAPLAGGFLFVAVVGLIVFISLARKKRSANGTYCPQKLELQAPRFELDTMMKPPNEERLI